MVMKYTYQMKDMYLVSDMNSAGNFLYYFLFGPKKYFPSEHEQTIDFLA